MRKNQRAVTASGSFWIYTAMALLAWIFTYLRLPELNGLSINDVHRAFGSDSDEWLADGPAQEQTAYRALPQTSSTTELGAQDVSHQHAPTDPVSHQEYLPLSDPPIYNQPSMGDHRPEAHA